MFHDITSVPSYDFLLVHHLGVTLEYEISYDIIDVYRCLSHSGNALGTSVFVRVR